MPEHTQKYELGRLDSAQRYLSGLDAEAAASLLGGVADLVLVIDGKGVIQDIALGAEELLNLGCREWIGQSWASVVTVESRPKVEALLADAQGGRRPAARQVNHPSLSAGNDLPVSYRVVPVRSTGKGQGGPVIAMGRDLRPERELQQRLVSAQVSMERDYWRLRHVETRYRLLFQQASEPILILDAGSEKLEEANPAAENLFGDAIRKASWLLPASLVPESAQALRECMVRVRATGRCDPFMVQMERGGEQFELTLSLFRQENSSHLLVRLSPASAIARPGTDTLPQLAELLQQAPDAFVVTDTEGRVLQVNRAFLDLTQVTSDDVVRGESLDRWLGRSGVDLNVLVSNLRQHGAVRLFATQLRGEFGNTTEVEISAVAAMSATRPAWGSPSVMSAADSRQPWRGIANCRARRGR